MCESCGCGSTTAHGHTHDRHHHHEQDHVHTHDHEHDHDHQHPHDHETRTVALEQRILSQNDEAAARNRQWLADHGVVAVNLISSPGTGKTMLLERTLDRLAERGVRCAVITGDQQTDHDARRLAGKGAIVRQIETVSACHLEAERVGGLLPEVTADGAKLLFIENVGNLVCPAAFDLGESFKIALLSTTEGEDKPVKYPALFAQAAVAVLTKMDLAPHLDWDLAVCRQYLRKVHPGMFVFELSARTGQGLDAWVDYLVNLVDE